MENLKEEFRTVIEFDDYEISNLGTLRNKHGRILKPTITKGYHRAFLRKNGKTYYRYYHRLVYQAFKGSLNKLEINHKDLDKSNNNLSNLEAVTRSENMRHAYDNGAFTGTRKRRVVVNNVTGVTYDNVRQAQKDSKYSYAWLNMMLNGKIENKSNFSYA